MFNDYLDVHAKDASSSENEVEELSEDDDGAVGNADVRAPDPLALPAGPAAAAAAAPADAALLCRATNCVCEEGSCIQTLDQHYVSSMRITNASSWIFSFWGRFRR